MEMIKTFLGVYDIPGDKDRLLEAIELNMEAAVKQQPMPVKVVVVEAEMYKHGTLFGFFIPAVFVIKREYQCPRCGKVLLKRLRFFRSEGYCLYSMGLCYQRRLKLCLGSRKVCVVRYIIVVAKEGK